MLFVEWLQLKFMVVTKANSIGDSQKSKTQLNVHNPWIRCWRTSSRSPTILWKFIQLMPSKTLEVTFNANKLWMNVMKVLLIMLCSILTSLMYPYSSISDNACPNNALKLNMIMRYIKSAKLLQRSTKTIITLYLMKKLKKYLWWKVGPTFPWGWLKQIIGLKNGNQNTSSNISWQWSSLWHRWFCSVSYQTFIIVTQGLWVLTNLNKILLLDKDKIM